MSVTIYSYPNNYRVWKSLIAAQFNGVKVATPEFKIEGAKSPEFLAKFPNGKVPAADTQHGPLYESGAIMKYVARLRADTGLFGANFYEAAQVEQWIDWCTFEVEPARGAWILPVWGVIDTTPRIAAEAKRDISKALATLDAHLLVNTYLVGNTVTLADIVVATAFVDLVRMVLLAKETDKFVNFSRWFNTLTNLEQFKAVLGDVVQATAEAQPKKAAGGDKKESAPKEKKEAGKKEAGKKPEAKKEAKKEAKAEAKKDDKEDLSHLLGDDGEAKADKPKEKNPLDLLPKSPMILDACKKLMFSEKPFSKKFFPALWGGSEEATRFDPAGYSVYSCEYKYNEDHKVYFLTCNLMGGFLQRSDRVRKYGFGVLNLCGESEEKAPWRLCGMWIFRGQGIPAEMTDVDDSEHFTWTKIDVTQPAGQQQVTEAFTGEKYQGQTVLEQRYFK